MSAPPTLNQIYENKKVVGILAEYFDFELVPEDLQNLSLDWFQIKADEEFKVFAREGAGGLFLIGLTTGRILYVTSEGSAGCIADHLVSLFQLFAAYPYWKDILHFSGGGKLSEMKRVPAYFEEAIEDDQPGIQLKRIELLKELGLFSVTDAIEKFHDVVSNDSKVHVYSANSDVKYDSLFNTFTVDDNPLWKS